MYSVLSTLNTMTEVPLSKAPSPQLVPGRRSINGCPLLRVHVHGVCVFTAVCVHFGWVNAEHKFQVWVTILGRMSRHFHFHFHYCRSPPLSNASFSTKSLLPTSTVCSDWPTGTVHCDWLNTTSMSRKCNAPFHNREL